MLQNRNSLYKDLQLLLRDTKLTRIVGSRVNFFRKLKRFGKALYDPRPFTSLEPYWVDIFSEACFCILTANFRADKSLLIQKELGVSGCLHYSYKKLLRILKKYGHRFAAQRATRILKLRENRDLLYEVVQMTDYLKAREVLIKNIDGYGLKEASHFLRNIGFLEVAIIDRHIFKYLKNNGLISNQKTITSRVYKEAEQVLQKISQSIGITSGELDLYLFYKQTGKVLK